MWSMSKRDGPWAVALLVCCAVAFVMAGLIAELVIWLWGLL